MPCRNLVFVCSRRSRRAQYCLPGVVQGARVCGANKIGGAAGEAWDQTAMALPAMQSRGVDGYDRAAPVSIVVIVPDAVLRLCLLDGLQQPNGEVRPLRLNHTLAPLHRLHGLRCVSHAVTTLHGDGSRRWFGLGGVQRHLPRTSCGEYELADAALSQGIGKEPRIHRSVQALRSSLPFAAHLCSDP